MQKLILIVLFFIAAFTNVKAQKNNDEQLAMQYFERKEFDKAVVYFDKLYDKLPDAYFTNYFTCLLETKDYSKAEKIIKKQIKRNSTATNLLVKLGKIYQLQHIEQGIARYQIFFLLKKWSIN